MSRQTKKRLEKKGVGKRQEESIRVSKNGEEKAGYEREDEN